MSNDEGRWKIVVYESQRAHELELNRATAAFEHAVVAPLFLLNGGAAVAFLTLLGAASAANSTLTVDANWSKWAIAMWAGGLFTATWAVGFGYYAQRDFTRSVNLRGRLLEHRLTASNEEFRAVLTPLPPPKTEKSDAADPARPNSALPANHDPQPIFLTAKKRQKWWLLLSALSSVLFLAGVVLAACAVLD